MTCRNRRQNSITSREHAITKMYCTFAPKLFKRKSVLAHTIDCGLRRVVYARDCVVGIGRSVRRTLAPRFTERRTPLHHSHPSTAQSVSCFSISSGCRTRARARAYLLLTDPQLHIQSRLLVHTNYTQLLRTNNFLIRVLCYI